MIVNTYEQTQAEEKFQQTVNKLKDADPQAWNMYQKLEEGTSVGDYEEFKQAAKAKIEEIQAMKGAIYTEEGKAAQIREDISKLADEFIQKTEEKNKVKAITLEELKTKLDDDIARVDGEPAENLEQLRAQTKTDLSFATHAREVEGILKNLVERGERDRSIARFVSTYGYMFAERAGDLAEKHDKMPSLHHIKQLVDKAKRKAYSEGTQAKIDIRNAIDKKFFGSSPSTRLIKMHRDSLLKKYK